MALKQFSEKLRGSNGCYEHGCYGVSMHLARADLPRSAGIACLYPVRSMVVKHTSQQTSKHFQCKAIPIFYKPLPFHYAQASTA